MDFTFFDEKVSSTVIISSATNKDHRDIHYLYKQRKAVALLVGEEGMKGYSEQQLIDIHTAIVRKKVDDGSGHWYDEWDSDLDSHLPDDLKLASDGYDPPPDQSIFDLEDYEVEYPKLLQDEGEIALWTAPTKRKDVPASHFLDQKNKKYPYKNSDGTINCTGLKTAISYAAGARGAPKRSGIKAKAQRIYDKTCKKKKAEGPIGILSSVGGTS